MFFKKTPQKKIKILQKGGAIHLSYSELIELIVNITKAHDNLTDSQYKDLCDFYNSFSKKEGCMLFSGNTKKFYDVAKTIILELETIAPYKLYSALTDEECSLLLTRIKEEDEYYTEIALIIEKALKKDEYTVEFIKNKLKNLHNDQIRRILARIDEIEDNKKSHIESQHFIANHSIESMRENVLNGQISITDYSLLGLDIILHRRRFAETSWMKLEKKYKFVIDMLNYDKSNRTSFSYTPLIQAGKKPPMVEEKENWNQKVDYLLYQIEFGNYTFEEKIEILYDLTEHIFDPPTLSITPSGNRYIEDENNKRIKASICNVFLEDYKRISSHRDCSKN